MSTLKDALCLLAIFFAYGITGHMDYEDAVMLEEAQRHQQPSTSTACWPAITSPTRHLAAQVHHLEPEPQSENLSGSASGTSPETPEPCRPVIY